MRLSTRLTLAMVGLVILTAAAVATLIHRNIEQRALPRVLDRIDTRAHLLTLQLEAAVAGVVRRIRERNLREELREAQYLLQESAGDERNALERRVERLAAQLGRVQLERSRSALYTTAPT